LTNKSSEHISACTNSQSNGHQVEYSLHLQSALQQSQQQTQKQRLSSKWSPNLSQTELSQANGLAGQGRKWLIPALRLFHTGGISQQIQQPASTAQPAAAESAAAEPQAEPEQDVKPGPEHSWGWSGWECLIAALKSFLVADLE